MFCLELYMPLFHHGVYGTNGCSSDVYSELELEVPDFEVYTPVKGSPICDSPVEEFELVSMSPVTKDELAREPRVALDDTASLEPTAPEEFDDFEWVEAVETPTEEEDLVVYDAATQGEPLSQGSTPTGSLAAAVPLPTVLNGGPVVARPPAERTPTARSAHAPLQDLNSARLPIALRKPSSFKLVKANAAYAVCRLAQYADRAISARGRRNPRLNADAWYLSMLR